MRVLGFGVAIILAFAKADDVRSYVPGTPGITWTEDQADIIKDKLNYFWDNRLTIATDFDFNNTDAPSSNTDYLYDPERRLSTVDCDWNEDLYQTYWSGKRLENIAFGPAKAVR